MIELLSSSLFIFWFVGSFSVLLDMDHIWMRFGRTEPINITHWPGRCLHHPIVFLLFSIFIGWFIFAPLYGFYVQISGQIGILATLFGESVLIAGTIILLYKFDKSNKKFLDKRLMNK